MKDFDYYLEKIGEIGFIEEVLHSIVYVSGLPGAHPDEFVAFESGDIGQIISLTRKGVEVLLLARSNVKVGTKVARSGEMLQVPVGNGLLGRVVDPLVKPLDEGKDIEEDRISPIDTQPHGIVGRVQATKPLETGTSVVDLIIPLAKGQRELVIGDRKTGKTEFLLQSLFTQAVRGTICIYAVIGQRLIDIKGRLDFIKEKGIKQNCVIVASSSSDPAGLVYLTPYTAMTIAEFFRDQDMDVLLILDDMTTHAKYYREITLLAKRFPGRAAYPGDIFYTQARLIERAGDFKRGSITCFPVSESLLGDLSGYIQTNLMAMTDGHIFFDIDLYNQGKRPAINSELSVTRVGHQAQTPLQRDLSRELSSFLVEYERMKQFMHFGAEAGEAVKKVLAIGSKLDVFFNQPSDAVVSTNANIVIIAGIWAGIWGEADVSVVESEIKKIISGYEVDKVFRKQVDELIASKESFLELVSELRQNGDVLLSKIGRKGNN